MTTELPRESPVGDDARAQGSSPSAERTGAGTSEASRGRAAVLLRWLREPRPIDLLLLGFLLGTYVGGSALFYRSVPEANAVELALLSGSVLTHGLLFGAGALLLTDGLLGRGRWWRALFAGVFFLVVVSQIPDWILFNIMGMHLTHLLRVFWTGGWKDLADLVAASRVSSANLAWMLSITWVSILFGGGMSMLTRRLAGRLPWKPALSVSAMTTMLLGSAVLLVGEQYVSLRTKDQRFWLSSQQTFPLHIPAIKPHPSSIVYDVRLRMERPDAGEERVIAEAASVPRPAAGRHVFLFMLESVRSGFVTPETAPHMTRFGDENLRFEHAWSNSNATMHGWYAVFHGHHPFYWKRYLGRPSFEGATSLRILQNLGYRLAVFSSADFNYWGYDRTVYGDGFKLVDTRESFSHLPQVEADRHTIDAAIGYLDRIPERAFVSIFLESAHHDYEWPKDQPPKFTPVTQSFDYTRVRYAADELEQVKNRYRNAIHYVDAQVGRFIEELRRRGLYESSTIVLIGDHGEEFMEHGRLTHASNLFEPQITPVFLMRLPSRGPERVRRSISQMQIFPTVLAELGYVPPAGVFDAPSVFDDGAGEPFQVISNVRSADAPHRFVIHFGDRKLFFELDEDDPYHGKSLYPTRITDGEDREIPFEGKGDALLKEVDAAYGPWLRRIGFIERMQGPRHR